MTITSNSLNFLLNPSKKHHFIFLETNVLSTQVFNDYDNIMSVIQKEMINSFLLHQNVVFNIKVVNTHL